MFRLFWWCFYLRLEINYLHNFHPYRKVQHWRKCNALALESESYIWQLIRTMKTPD